MTVQAHQTIMHLNTLKNMVKPTGLFELISGRSRNLNSDHIIHMTKNLKRTFNVITDKKSNKTCQHQIKLKCKHSCQVL